MKQANLEHTFDDSENEAPDTFYGAAVITEAGEEIPITEQMLERSFSALIEAWEIARKQGH